jgi:Kef-type K+ transport system membrane component KefB
MPGRLPGWGRRAARPRAQSTSPPPPPSQLLKERGELETRFGQATLGILLFQDIATVPFLVLLPLIEGGGASALADGGAGTAVLLAKLGPTILQTFAVLGLVLLGGRTVIRRVFGMVADARSDDTFIALCLLTVTGAAVLTQRMGFSDTLGAFVAGVLLAETNYKTQARL